MPQPKEGNFVLSLLGTFKKARRRAGEQGGTGSTADSRTGFMKKQPWVYDQGADAISPFSCLLLPCQLEPKTYSNQFFLPILSAPSWKRGGHWRVNVEEKSVS